MLKNIQLCCFKLNWIYSVEGKGFFLPARYRKITFITFLSLKNFFTHNSVFIFRKKEITEGRWGLQNGYKFRSPPSTVALFCRFWTPLTSFPFCSTFQCFRMVSFFHYGNILFVKVGDSSSSRIILVSQKVVGLNFQ